MAAASSFEHPMSTRAGEPLSLTEVATPSACPPSNICTPPHHPPGSKLIISLYQRRLRESSHSRHARSDSNGSIHHRKFDEFSRILGSTASAPQRYWARRASGAHHSMSGRARYRKGILVGLGRLVKFGLMGDESTKSDCLRNCADKKRGDVEQSLERR